MRRACFVVDGVEFCQRVKDRSAERVAVEVTPRRRDDPGRVGKLIAAFAMKERGIELTEGQIAGPAEDDEIEWLDLDIAYGHDASLWVVERSGGCSGGPSRLARSKLTDLHDLSQGRAIDSHIESQLT